MRLSFLPAPLVCGVARGFFVCLDIFGVCLQGWFHPKMLFLLLDVFDFEFLNPAFRRRSTLRCFSCFWMYSASGALPPSDAFSLSGWNTF